LSINWRQIFCYSVSQIRFVTQLYLILLQCLTGTVSLHNYILFCYCVSQILYRYTIISYSVTVSHRYCIVTHLYLILLQCLTDTVCLHNYILFSTPLGSTNKIIGSELPEYNMNAASVLRLHGHHVNNVDDWTLAAKRQMLSRHLAYRSVW
jgi:hypothetical protein